VRVTGKRTVGQFTPFDLIVVMLLSEAVSGSINGQDESLPGGLIAAATLVVLDVLIAVASSHSRRIDAAVQGSRNASACRAATSRRHCAKPTATSTTCAW
jgi:uncharacterized membrane protein YcaP (DUF421 family)